MGSTEQTMWPLSLTALLSCSLTSLAAEVTPGASLYSQRQQYAQAYPYSTQDEDKTSLSNMMYALSPILLPPPSHAAEEADEAAKYYYSYYSNTEENADKYYAAYNTADTAQKHYSPTDFNTDENADKYYYPYYFNTEENADLFYKKASPESDPWLAYYDRLPQHAGRYQGPQDDELPQHTGQYQGPDHSGHLEEVDPQENMIFDVPRIFLKGFD